MNAAADEAVRLLADVKGVGMTRFKAADVVRHPMVQRIIEAYDAEYGDEGRWEGIDGRPGR